MKINNKTLFTANIILNSVPSLIDYIHIIEGGNEIQIVTNKSKINKLFFLILYGQLHSICSFNIKNARFYVLIHSL